jgi:Phosphotransferase enzyme family
VTAAARPAANLKRSHVSGARVEEALAGRAGIEGVWWLLGGRAARGVIRDHLGELMEERGELGRCRLRRAKFKPGRKLSAYYDVALAGGGPVRPIAVTWQPRGAVADVVDPAEDDMQTEAVRAGLAAPWARLRGGDAELGLRILVAPLDIRFPNLVRACTPAHVHAVVSALDATGDGSSALESGSSYSVSPVRYRPGQRHVLRYDPIARDGRLQPDHALFAKLYAPKEGAAAFRVAAQIADWLAASDTGTSAVRPLAHVPEDEIVLYPRVTGTPLSRYPVQHAAPHLARAGSALSALQRAPVGLFEEVRPHSFSEEVRAIARAAEHVPALLPGVGSVIEGIIERARDLNERLAEEAPVLAHGDYKADHAWVTRRGLTLIDFNTCSLADPALDIGKFLADLRWWYFDAGEERTRWAQRHFLEGYGSHGSDRLARARLFEVLILTKITVRRVLLFDVGWAAKTETLIHRASELLGDLEENAGPTTRDRRMAAETGT